MITNKLIHRTFLIASVLCALACSKDDGNTGAAKPAMPQEAQDINSKINSFESEGIFSEVVKDEAERNKIQYTIGCGDEQGKIDKDIRIGDKNIIRILQSKADSHMEMIQSQTALKLGENSEALVEILSVDVPEAGGQILKNKFSYKTSCLSEEKNSDGQKQTIRTCGPQGEELEKMKTGYLENMTVAAKEFLKSRDHKYEDCFIESVNQLDKPIKPSQKTVEIGKFHINDGLKIKAFKTTEISEGDVICQIGNVKEKIGTGKAISVIIKSNEVVPKTDDFYNCGGSTLVYASTITLGDKVIGSTRLETMTARLR